MQAQLHSTQSASMKSTQPYSPILSSSNHLPSVANHHHKSHDSARRPDSPQAQPISSQPRLPPPSHVLEYGYSQVQNPHLCRLSSNVLHDGAKRLKTEASHFNSNGVDSKRAKFGESLSIEDYGDFIERCEVRESDALMCFESYFLSCSTSTSCSVHLPSLPFSATRRQSPLLLATIVSIGARSLRMKSTMSPSMRPSVSRNRSSSPAPFLVDSLHRH